MPCFNPRPREGGDSQCKCTQGAAVIVSIHAPVKGATEGREVSKLTILSFNPRPREGGDQVVVVTNASRRKFQSTPP